MTGTACSSTASGRAAFSKDELELVAWLRDLAPGAELRTWFGHEPARWEKFRERYFSELEEHRDAILDLLGRVEGRRLTLVYGAEDTEHNQAVALREYLCRHVG